MNYKTANLIAAFVVLIPAAILLFNGETTNGILILILSGILKIASQI